MHVISIADEIVERSRRLRGDRKHIFDVVDPARTAHIIVDLQNGFMRPGAPVEVPMAREVVSNVNHIARVLRAAGGLNVFLRYTYDDSEPVRWPAFYEGYSDPSYTAMVRSAFTRGAADHDLWPGLDVRPDDLIIDKTRFSAFIAGTCDLHDVLQRCGIDTLIITGTVTNCCCESTARDAMQMNYKIIFVADGNAAFTDAEHNATLSSMMAIFADVMTTGEVCSVIAANADPIEQPTAA